MAWKKIEDPKWYHHPVPWILIFLAAAAFFAGPRAMRRYARWNATQQVRLATDELARGDFKQALLHARAVLEVNPSDAGATRIMAQGLELAEVKLCGGIGSCPNPSRFPISRQHTRAEIPDVM